MYKRQFFSELYKLTLVGGFVAGVAFPVQGTAASYSQGHYWTPVQMSGFPQYRFRPVTPAGNVKQSFYQQNYPVSRQTYPGNRPVDNRGYMATAGYKQGYQFRQPAYTAYNRSYDASPAFTRQFSWKPSQQMTRTLRGSSESRYASESFQPLKINRMAAFRPADSVARQFRYRPRSPRYSARVRFNDFATRHNNQRMAALNNHWQRRNQAMQRMLQHRAAFRPVTQFTRYNPMLSQLAQTYRFRPDPKFRAVKKSPVIYKSSYENLPVSQEIADNYGYSTKTANPWQQWSFRPVVDMNF